MHRHTNGCSIPTACRRQSEKQQKAQKKTIRKGSPGHAATLNDAHSWRALKTCYSVRSTCMGSVDAARCAGTKQATSAVASSTHPTTAKAETSNALTP